jgi:predicted deacylase
MSYEWEALTPDEMWRGWWEPTIAGVPPLPVLAAHGQRDGPTVLVTGAVHGDEYEGPAAIYALFNGLDTAKLSGTVIGLPIINGAAWEARARVAPTDRLDLNRLFPGTKDAANQPSRALAEAVFETFVRRCDVLVDLHSGGAKLVHLPMIGWYAGSSEGERLARSFAENEEMMPWRIGNVPGVLSHEAHRAGKIALGAEWGGGASLDPAGVAAYSKGLRRTLAHLAGEEAGPGGSPLDLRNPISGSYVQTQQGGLFAASVKLGEQVAQGATLGRLYSPLGEVIGEITAERSGIVAALAHIALISPGDRMAYIG